MRLTHAAESAPARSALRRISLPGTSRCVRRPAVSATSTTPVLRLAGASQPLSYLGMGLQPRLPALLRGVTSPADAVFVQNLLQLPLADVGVAKNNAVPVGIGGVLQNQLPLLIGRQLGAATCHTRSVPARGPPNPPMDVTSTSRPRTMVGRLLLATAALTGDVISVRSADN